MMRSMHGCAWKCILWLASQPEIWKYCGYFVELTCSSSGTSPRP